MTNLYQLDQGIFNLLLASVDPDTGEIKETAIDALEELELSRQEKLKNIILYIKNLRNESDIIQMEIDRLQALKGKVERKVSNMEWLLSGSMERKGENAIDFVTCGAKFTKNPHKVVIKDEDKVPDEYKKEEISVSVNRKQIKSDLKAGKEVDGCYLDQDIKLKIY